MQQNAVNTGRAARGPRGVRSSGRRVLPPAFFLCVLLAWCGCTLHLHLHYGSKHYTAETGGAEPGATTRPADWRPDDPVTPDELIGEAIDGILGR